MRTFYFSLPNEKAALAWGRAPPQPLCHGLLTQVGDVSRVLCSSAAGAPSCTSMALAFQFSTSS